MTTYVDEELLRSAKILAAKRDGKIYEVFEDALRRYYLEVMGGPEASREETRGDGAQEGRQPRPRVPLLSGSQDSTLGKRFEEELYRS
jgi:hypothetical protein